MQKILLKMWNAQEIYENFDVKWGKMKYLTIEVDQYICSMQNFRRNSVRKNNEAANLSKLIIWSQNHYVRGWFFALRHLSKNNVYT